jgi:hypothetical protein
MPVCADYPGTGLMGLPLPSWAQNAGAIGIRLVDSDTGKVVVKVEPSPIVLPELGMSIFTLAPGICRRMLFDISAYLNANVSPEHYDLAVIYAASPHRVESPVVPIELLAPSDTEREELDRCKPVLTRAGSWGRWTNLPPPDGGPVEPPTDSHDPLRFNRILRYLMYGPTELSVVDPAVIELLHGVYEPESHALLAELYWARQDAARFAEHAAIIRTSFPGLAWWIERIEAGRSEIAFVRRCWMRSECEA